MSPNRSSLLCLLRHCQHTSSVCLSRSELCSKSSHFLLGRVDHSHVKIIACLFITLWWASKTLSCLCLGPTEGLPCWRLSQLWTSTCSFLCSVSVSPFLQDMFLLFTTGSQRQRSVRGKWSPRQPWGHQQQTALSSATLLSAARCLLSCHARMGHLPLESLAQGWQHCSCLFRDSGIFAASSQ